MEKFKYLYNTKFKISEIEKLKFQKINVKV